MLISDCDSRTLIAESVLNNPLLIKELSDIVNFSVTETVLLGIFTIELAPVLDESFNFRRQFSIV